jgi:hypothetical protein
VVPLTGVLIVIELTPGIVKRKSVVPVVKDVYCVGVNILDVYGNDANPFFFKLIYIASDTLIFPSLFVSYCIQCMLFRIVLPNTLSVTPLRSVSWCIVVGIGASI